MRVNLKKSIFILPNLFTLASVFCGYYSIIICSSNPQTNDFYRAALLIILGMFCDAIDGRVARLTRTQTALGVQLDSLADIISFGVAPAVLVYQWALAEIGVLGVIFGFIYAGCGAIRLARFNVTTTDITGAPKKPSKYSQGLPIPAAAGFLISLVVANTLAGKLPFSPVLISLLLLALAVLMVSSVRFRTFKDLKLTTRSVPLILGTFAATGFIAIYYHPSYALVFLLASYVVIGLLEGLFGLIVAARHPAEPTPDPKSI